MFGAPYRPLVTGTGRNPFVMADQTQSAQRAKPAADTGPWLKKPMKRLNGRTILAASRKAMRWVIVPPAKEPHG